MCRSDFYAQPNLTSTTNTKLQRDKIMKLGVAYNIFNGDELLEDSLKRIRKHADYIILTYQKVSNIGNLANESLSINIKDLGKELYDEIVEFIPNPNKPPKENETNKRQLGLCYAKKNKCTHFLSIDCDEFYDDNQFSNAKTNISKNNWGATACELRNYFHSSKYQMKEKKRYVPFIAEINFWSKFKLFKKLPVNVDPSRVCYNRRFHLFNEEELIMHHMSYVRKDIASLKSKLCNSPNHSTFEPFLDEYLVYFNCWAPNIPALNPHDYIKNITTEPNIIIIDNPIELSINYIKNENFTNK